jgi:hypothetical protein
MIECLPVTLFDTILSSIKCRLCAHYFECAISWVYYDFGSSDIPVFWLPNNPVTKARSERFFQSFVCRTNDKRVYRIMKTKRVTVTWYLLYFLCVGRLDDQTGGLVVVRVQGTVANSP